MHQSFCVMAIAMCLGHWHRNRKHRPLAPASNSTLAHVNGSERRSTRGVYQRYCLAAIESKNTCSCHGWQRSRKQRPLVPAWVRGLRDERALIIALHAEVQDDLSRLMQSLEVGSERLNIPTIVCSFASDRRIVASMDGHIDSARCGGQSDIFWQWLGCRMAFDWLG